MIVDRACQRGAYARGVLKIGEARAHHSLQTSEMREQRSTTRRSESGHRLEHGFAIAPRASTTMTCNGKSVCLIAHPLNEVQRCAVGLQHNRVRSAMQK